MTSKKSLDRSWQIPCLLACMLVGKGACHENSHVKENCFADIPSEKNGGGELSIVSFNYYRSSQNMNWKYMMHHSYAINLFHF